MSAKPTFVVTLWPLLAAFASGAAIMAFELLGARMLGAAFGGSIVVWGAMLAVALLSLAAGYLAGGRLADRHPRPDLAAGALLAAAAWAALTPSLRPFLRACAGLPCFRLAVLAAATGLLCLPLALAAMVTPCAVKLLATTRDKLGFAAGGIYAIATVGSALGALLTAFWLIPGFGISTGFRILAVTLGIVAASGFVADRRWRAGMPLILCAPLLALPAADPQPGDAYRAPDGETVCVDDVRDSLYGRWVVLRKGPSRLLLMNGIVQTGMPLDASPVEQGQGLHDRYLQELIAYTHPQPAGRRALMIGLAGGMTAALLRAHGMDVDAVDLDPAAADLARRWFGFPGRVVVADGRRYMETCAERYDFCIVDAYLAEGVPGHLMTREAFEASRRVLLPGGALVVNYIGSPAGEGFAAVCNTIGAVFPHLLAFRSELSDDVQALTILAGDQPIAFTGSWPESTDDAGVDPMQDTLARLTIPLPPRAGLVLCDDFNPLDTLRADEAIAWRANTARHIGRAAMQ